MKSTWSELIERAAHDDQEAFSELYQNSYDAVYRTVKSMIRDDDAVLDIVQDAYIKGFGSLSTLEDPESFVAWMKRIATNKAKDQYKKRHDINFSEMADEDGGEPDFKDEALDHMPEAVIDRNETARLIEAILSTLSDEQRLVVGMFYYQNMSVAEIAEAIGVSENTVKSRLYYGRKKIRAGVEELEKRGTKLYGLAPIPFLIWLFRSQIATPAVGAAPTAVFENIMAGVSSAASSAASAAATTSAATADTASTAKAASATTAKTASTLTTTSATTADTASTSTTTSATTAKTPSASTTASASSSATTSTASAATASSASSAGTKFAGLFSSLGAKITAGVLAVAIVGGGVGTAIYMSRHSDNSPEATETGTYTGSQTNAPESTNAVTDNGQDIEVNVPGHTSEELLSSYLDETLLPEHGIYNVNQPGYFEDVYGAIDKTTFKFDPATKAFSSEHVNVIALGNEDYAPMADEFNAAKENMDLSGIYGADICDYDGDGEPELLAVYGEGGSLYLEMFDVIDGKVTSVGKRSFDELLTAEMMTTIEQYKTADGITPFSYFNHGYMTRSIGRFLSSDGTAYIVISDQTNQVSTVTPRYLRISGSLEPVSCMIVDVISLVNDSSVEFYYDGKAASSYDVADYFNGESDKMPACMNAYIGGSVTEICMLYQYGGAPNDFIAKYYEKYGEVTPPPTTGSEEEGLKFTLTDAGNSYAVTGIGNSKDTDLVIPESYNGMPVTEIGASAFKQCKELKSVVIPDGVTIIGDDAFKSCENLVSITIPNGLTRIGVNAFENCYALAKIDLPDSLTEIGENAFCYCLALPEITIPKNIKRIEYVTFSNCESLTRVVLPDGLEVICENAFEGCFGLTDITIPNSVTEIGQYAFWDCSSLTKFTIPDSITTIEAALFCFCVNLTDITIPDTVTTIGDSAFYGCEALEKITIPKSVTSIEHSAFGDCPMLTHITIPAGVTYVGGDAFSGCPALESITFNGTTDVWESFDVWQNGREYPTCVVHCIDGDLQK